MGVHAGMGPSSAASSARRCGGADHVARPGRIGERAQGVGEVARVAGAQRVHPALGLRVIVEHETIGERAGVERHGALVVAAPGGRRELRHVAG